jgi:hypothetical protein
MSFSRRGREVSIPVFKDQFGVRERRIVRACVLSHCFGRVGG